MSATTKPPSKIILAGDSAGASLALGVLSHVTHKHPEIEPLELPEPFRAAVLASPWVDFDNRGQSYHKYAERDPMTTSTLKRWSADYLGGAKKDYYNEPGKAPVEWWQDLPVKDVLVVGGACEMMEDDIKSLGERLKASEWTTEMADFADMSNRKLEFLLRRLWDQMNSMHKRRLEGILGWQRVSRHRK